MPSFCVWGEGFGVLVECALGLVCRCLQCCCLDDLDCPSAGFASGAQANAKAGASHERICVAVALCALSVLLRALPTGLRALSVDFHMVSVHILLPCGLRALSDPRASACKQCLSNVAQNIRKKPCKLLRKIGPGPANASKARRRPGQGPASTQPAPGQGPASAQPWPCQRPARARPAPGQRPATAQPGPGLDPVNFQ